MKKRTERARYLGEQLASSMEALGTGTRGPDVIVFLDRLARLEAYPAEELTAVPDLAELVAEAVRARAEHAVDLGKVAGFAFDLDRLLDDGRHLPPDDVANERDSWLRDALVLATLAPWLSPARRRQAEWTLEKARAIIEADAESFLDSSVLVSDRRALEAPERLGVEARKLLRVLGDLPLLVAFDGVPAQSNASRVDAALRNLDPAVLAAADDALADHDGRGRFQLPSAGERQALTATDEVHTTLVRMEGGRWVLVRRPGSLQLYFEGEEMDLGVSVVEGAELGDLLADAARRYLLPASDEGLTLRLRVGPDSRVVRIEGHPS